MPRFALAIGATATATVLGFAVPLFVQVILDSVFLGEALPPFGFVRRIVALVGGVETLRANLLIGALVLIVLQGGNGALSFVAARSASVGAERAARWLRDRLYGHLQRVSMAWYGTANTGDTLQRCTSDVDTVRRFHAIQMVEVGRAAAMVLLAIPVMWRLHPRLALIAVATFPLAFGYTFWFFLRVQEAFQKSDEAEGALSGVLQEHLSGLRVVRAFAREPQEMERFVAHNDEYRDVTMKLLVLLARYWGLSSALVISQLGAVLVAGSFFAVGGTLTVGGLLVFVTLEYMLLWPIRQMGMVLADLGKAQVALGRIEEILNVPEEDDDPALSGPGTKRPEIAGAVTFDHVSFGYGQGAPTLEDISFSIDAGTTVGVLGATGSGKTTLMMLLARLYDPSSGRILVDGVELSEIERQWMRQHTAFVLQEPFLFARTVRENISLAKSAVTDAEVFASARAAAIHDVIEGFSHGYETSVGEKGVTLSGGQKQRVAIARALITEAPILVFDDSLSAVDTRTDAQIRSALLERKATTFLISHRVTTLVRTDVVVVLEGGRVVEMGPPRELLETEGIFAKTWALQQGDYDGSVQRTNVHQSV